jgi:hypothetical protein
MAHTFDDVSKSSATNYLFFFAQRALAHHNEPPTPPPLNALGLPCLGMCRLWALLYPEHAARQKYLSVYLKSIKATDLKSIKATKEKAAMELKGACKLTGSWNFSTGSWSFFTVQPLADKIKEYILDHLDDGAQEVVKRDMATSFREHREASEMSLREHREASEKSFREQREASEKSFRVQREESGKQREEILQTVNEKMQAGMQKVQEEVQSMQQRFDDVHLKLDETILLVRVLALESGHS